MRLFDSHCHIDDESYAPDLDKVLERAGEAGVLKMLAVGITLKSSRRAVAIASENKGVYATVGVHPHDAKSCTDQTLGELRKLAENPVVRAWGETGLDFNRMFSPQKVQERRFTEQVRIAGELGLPLVFHERDSGGRFLELLRAERPDGLSGVVHCFSGNRDELFAYLDLGLHIGITGILTHKARGGELRKLAVEIPEDRMLIETDAPYLTPSPERNRNRRNEPAFVASVFRTLVTVRKADPAALSETLWENTCRLFGIREDA